MEQEIVGKQNGQQQEESLSSKIKLQTKSAHQFLEKIVVSRLKNIKSEADYADLLKYFYTYFGEVEKAAYPFISDNILPDHNLRRKAARLRADIETLGSCPNSIDVSVPAINSAASAMGALYVMEGSVMGGPIIIDMLRKLGITRGFGFFSGYGAETGKMWGAFIAALNNVASGELEEQQAIAAAESTFSGFADLFSRK